MKEIIQKEIQEKIDSLVCNLINLAKESTDPSEIILNKIFLNSKTFYYSIKLLNAIKKNKFKDADFFIKEICKDLTLNLNQLKKLECKLDEIELKKKEYEKSVFRNSRS